MSWRELLREMLDPSSLITSDEISYLQDLLPQVDVNDFIGELGRILRVRLKRKGIENVEVKGGPWRGYDVLVSYDKDRDVYEVDFYSPMRINPRRVMLAYTFALGFIEGHSKGRDEVLKEL